MNEEECKDIRKAIQENRDIPRRFLEKRIMEELCEENCSLYRMELYVRLNETGGSILHESRFHDALDRLIAKGKVRINKRGCLCTAHRKVAHDIEGDKEFHVKALYAFGEYGSSLISWKLVDNKWIDWDDFPELLCMTADAEVDENPQYEPGVYSVTMRISYTVQEEETDWGEAELCVEDTDARVVAVKKAVDANGMVSLD
jgi:DNA polymerase elongation subunit (family B)